MSKIVGVTFVVINEERFQEALQRAFESDENVVGMRTDDAEVLRPALSRFADAMEVKLRKNDHKTSWLELPPEALFKLLMVEIEEFKVSYEYMKFVGKEEARAELVDVANYALILWDRISKLPKDTK